jgi:hypothetical protein
MSHLNSLRRFRLCSALAGTFLFTVTALAQAPQGVSGATNALPRLAATLQPGETIGREQVVREFLRSGTNEFIFVVPDGTRAETAPAGQIALSSWEQRFYISIRLLEFPTSTPRLKEALRARIVSEYPRATNVELFDTTVGNKRSSGFQLHWNQPGTGLRLVRAVCVPCPAGLLEFTLNTDTHSAPAGQRALNQVLLTLRSNEGGKLEIVRRSDKT